MTTTVTSNGTTTRTSTGRPRRARHIGMISHGGLAVAARRAAATRRELSPAAKAALVDHARTYLPGTVLKAGSEELGSAEIWTLLIAGPDRPRLVKG